MLTINFMPPPQSRRSGSGMVAQCRRRSERNRAGTRRVRPVRLRLDRRFDIKALCLQAVDGHAERSSGRLFCYQTQKKGVRSMKNTEEIWSLVDAKEAPFTQLSDRVWGMPELCYGEFRSCAEHTETLERRGFRGTKENGGVPTAGGGGGAGGGAGGSL